MEKYTVIEKIGEGAHGLVVKAKYKENGKIIALKKLGIKNVNEGIPLNIFREIKCLQHVDNKYIVELMEVFAHGPNIVLAFEYAPSSLYQILRTSKSMLTPSLVKTYSWMLLQGVQHLHNLKIMHRDLKPNNLLISHTGVLKIADFGLARLFLDDVECDDKNNIIYKKNSRPYSHQVATRWYRAPELLYGARYYTHAVDLWAVGCIIAEMINKEPLFPGETDIEQLAIVLKTLGTPTSKTWPGLETLPDYNKISFSMSEGLPWSRIISKDAQQEVIDLVKSFLQYNSNLRISSTNALSHPYFHTPPFKLSTTELPIPKEGHHASNSRYGLADTSQASDDDIKTLVP